MTHNCNICVFQGLPFPFSNHSGNFQIYLHVYNFSSQLLLFCPLPEKIILSSGSIETVINLAPLPVPVALISMYSFSSFLLFFLLILLLFFYPWSQYNLFYSIVRSVVVKTWLIIKITLLEIMVWWVPLQIYLFRICSVEILLSLYFFLTFSLFSDLGVLSL